MSLARGLSSPMPPGFGLFGGGHFVSGRLARALEGWKGGGPPPSPTRFAGTWFAAVRQRLSGRLGKQLLQLLGQAAFAAPPILCPLCQPAHEHSPDLTK